MNIQNPLYHEAECTSGTVTANLGSHQSPTDGCDVNDLTAACGYTIDTLSAGETYTLTITFDYVITYVNFESQEFFSVMVQLIDADGTEIHNSTPYQSPGGTCCDNNIVYTFSDEDVTVTIDDVPGGIDYELLLGGYLNRKTGSEEFGTVVLDNIVIVATPDSAIP